jgi:hypothetical protein
VHCFFFLCVLFICLRSIFVCVVSYSTSFFQSIHLETLIFLLCVSFCASSLLKRVSVVACLLLASYILQVCLFSRFLCREVIILILLIFPNVFCVQGFNYGF